ncbi:hypothetical protein COZ82_00130 [Candidatus Kaiserbacteria bacterium CG_4_8_14_3_um_filter_38_9]|uniref:Uncharacterized protein n=1 Tax=Candidatus Kaiserbacteria bacterium CG_4_8_14_3_um_filter_38_9 TaxID=1974599 RepID=A0A2M7IPT7_9BACT|nr:MAG: hypothetical protein COZ82_00130 [Candidatus Kaiserbacteria bacterium CG_4_8_14_3_um_filter_38_9]
MFGNKKVTGAFLIGFALIAGSYVVSNFGKNAEPITANIYTATTPLAPRIFIPIVDSDQNGVEDWREDFVSETPLIIDESTSTVPYEMPTSLTDQVGIQLFQSILEAKAMGKVGPSQTEIIQKAADQLRKTVKDVIYGPNNVTTIPLSPTAVRTYGNTMAQIILNNNQPDSENELTILDRAVKSEDPEELKKLNPLALMYKNLRDQSIATPVPEPFLKQHLDLINTYQALYKNLSDMQLVFSDPVVALMRVKRYQDDAIGLSLALQNIYNMVLPYASVFESNDPAVLFVVFDPNYQ